ncbi:transcriptional regulator [Aurantimonas sp. Leaf443]|nr:transcriptional regulator [Aurantimonas sp. Leaf443]
MMTLRQMRYFEALSQTLHFGRAARRLNISQPALSAQIAQMEELFGGPLFLRGPAGVQLSADGILVGARVARVLAEVRELESLASAGAGLLTGRLRLGMIASVAPYLLPRVLARLTRDHPSLDCGVRESVTDRLIDDLNAGDIDCAILALPVEERGLETLPLFEDVFHLAVPEGEAGRFADAVDPATLRGERMILMEEGHCLRDQALQICRIADPGERSGFGATSLATILRMVAGGLGATLIPQMAVEDERGRGGLAILPFAPPSPSRTIALAFRPSTARRRDFEALAQILREERSGA